MLGRRALTVFALVLFVVAVVAAYRRRRIEREPAPAPPPQEIIASVERRATELPREDPRTLVEPLEVEHGRFEMRRLRRLLFEGRGCS